MSAAITVIFIEGTVEVVLSWMGGMGGGGQKQKDIYRKYYFF